MSLTSFIQIEEVRRRFREEFEKPKMEATPELVAPPHTDRPSHVGTAFDYLMRFTLSRVNREVVRGREWVAEAALDLLSGSQRERALQTIEWAKSVRDAYVSSGETSDELYKAALNLARLDVAVRTKGKQDVSEFDPVKGGDVEDLRQLHQNIPDAELESGKVCLLNPTFGKASALVGGADADLLVDDTLIEIKTLTDASLGRDTFNQLLGYYTLHVIDGIGELEAKPTIRRVGVYFSRHAYLHTIELDDAIERSTYPHFVEWFALNAMNERLH